MFAFAAAVMIPALVYAFVLAAREAELARSLRYVGTSTLTTDMRTGRADWTVYGADAARATFSLNGPTVYGPRTVTDLRTGRNFATGRGARGALAHDAREMKADMVCNYEGARMDRIRRRYADLRISRALAECRYNWLATVQEMIANGATVAQAHDAAA